ncbi:NADH-quinone oxidoreductase [Flexivirga endophytica]|uniref:NADH-quinone oxidoreductase n=1 Tax=Flexivirga endophytica TaxID=1849103 RepID=A0A916WTK4_9MICO|nr:NADH-quinone oxidoreductase subunit G [Flexivirga endophytica]GGB28601.1 NADH-quinone oxidoreductase [Flexivirga endophytica]GHB62278.1 NADH-quinone oxidoreductase [Flexivirga endophytica]
MTAITDKTPEAPPAEDLVTLTIDGAEVSVPKGTLVIRAAEKLGVQIPRFCDHPLLDPVGACRQCLVEVPDAGNGRGMPKPQASCTLAVAEGMKVETQVTSAVADKAQHGQMEFLLINHPLDCPVCDKGGECPLQNQAMSNGRPKSRFEDVKRTYPKPINISSQVLLDRDRCILCARCTRFSDQIAGDQFIALIERGALQQVGIYEEKPFESYFSGNTVQICPVGALTGAAYRFRSRPFDLVSTPSVCEHCASGCSIRTDHRRGVVLRRMALDDPAVNEEWNCDKGRWAFKYATSSRLQTPLVRDENGDLRVAAWPEALEIAAKGLAQAKAAGGVGVLTGGRVSAEDAYAYSKFARLVLDTNDIDFRSRPLSAEEADFLASSVVATDPDGDSVTFTDLEKAPSVLLVGIEPEEESPIIFLRLRKGNRNNKVKVMSVAPFVTRGLAKMGGTLIAAAPGTEAEVLDAITAASGDLAETAEQLSADSVILVGERMATVPGALSSVLALARAKGARVAWVPRRAGERGALEAGAIGNLLPGGRPVGDAAARAQVGTVWGAAELPEQAGRDTDAILAAAASGDLAGLVVGGVDPRDLADQHTAQDGLEKAFVVSLELRESPVAPYADVILPVAAQQEKAGSYVNWEGRVRPFERAIESTDIPDFRALDLLAAELGEFLGTRSTAQVQAEMRELGAFSGERPSPPRVKSRGVPRPLIGEAVLATWSHLLDKGALQDGEPFLAGTAFASVARLSAATAASVGVREGERLEVSTKHGAITLPVVITEMPDYVVWLPTNSTDSAVRATLGADGGAIVALAKAPAEATAEQSTTEESAQ